MGLKFQFKVKQVAANGQISYSTSTIGLPKKIDLEGAFAMITSHAKNMIFGNGTLPLTIDKANLMGWRDDSIGSHFFIDSMEGSILGQIYTMHGGFSGLGGKLFKILLSSNLTPIAKLKQLMDKSVTLKEYLRNPNININEVTGEITDKVTGKIVGKMSDIEKFLNEEGNPSIIVNDQGQIINQYTGEPIGDVNYTVPVEVPM